jgi:hypothetical protein
VNADPKELRAYVARIALLLRREPDREKVRTGASKLAATIDLEDRFKLRQWVDAIPIDVPPDVRRLRWFGRDEHTNFAVEKLLEEAESAIRAIEDHQDRLAANASLSLDERRVLVLRTIALIDERNEGGEFAFGDLEWDSKLSRAHVWDAVEHWLEYGAIRYGIYKDGGDHPSRYRLTPRGRDRNAKGPPPQELPIVAGTYVAGDFAVHQHGAGSVQQVGVTNAAHVIQLAIPNLAPVIAAIQEHLAEYPEAEREEVAEQLALIEEERQRPKPRPSRIKAAFNAILRITKEVGDAVSPLVQATVAGVVQGINPS